MKVSHRSLFRALKSALGLEWRPSGGPYHQRPLDPPKEICDYWAALYHGTKKPGDALFGSPGFFPFHDPHESGVTFWPTPPHKLV